jgi:hypothetical protein
MLGFKTCEDLHDDFPGVFGQNGASLEEDAGT